MKGTAFRIRVPLLALILAAWFAWPAAEYATGLERPASRPSTRPTARSTVDLLVVSANDARLVPPVAALAGRLSGPRHLPALLVSTGSVGQPAEDLFVRQLQPRQCLVLKTDGARSPVGDSKKIDTRVVELGKSLTQASLDIARRFWGKSEKVVLARATEPSALILASALAAHMKAPLIAVDDATDRKALKAGLGGIKARRLLAVTARGAAGAPWPGQLLPDCEVLDVRQAAGRLVRTIGPQQVRNIIVARAPDTEALSSATAPLAAYLSLARKAPIVLCRSGDGRQVEAEVLAFIKTHGLKPRTITLLGDHQAIGVISVSDREALGEYTVEIEPCSGPIGRGAAAYGVGRIPQPGLSDASLLIARGIARPRIIGRRRPRILMIANPRTEYGTLPFAETVSRVMAQEFKNLGLPIDEFYGKPADSPDVVKASADAHLIIFQGHVTDQLLFQDPTPIEPEPGEEDVTVLPDDVAALIVDPRQGGIRWGLAAAEGLRPAPVPAGLHPAPVSELPVEPIGGVGAADPGQLLPLGGQAVEAGALTPSPDLEGLPLVILQSCHSLDQVVAQKVFGQGGVGMVGSVTNIHSASGSAFAKAYCDGLMYEGKTAGGALRDARNYFLCLARLKAQRKHTEQAKVYRAGMSFRLWGDPEVAFLPNGPTRMRWAPVSAKFVAPDKVQVTTPVRFLPECRSTKYVARMLPGSQAAGIVKRLKGKEHRRLMPTYFFVLPAPQGFSDGRYARLQGEGDAAQRAVFMTDSVGKNVYLLYFPDKDKRRGEITLQFAK